LFSTFTDQPLSEETILAILNAGRRAQSSKNTQPWHFIAITDKEILQQLAACAEAGSAGRTNTWHLAGAALGVALIHPHPDDRFQTLFDIGQAAAYMQLAAWELGVGSCPATIYQYEKARPILHIPPEMHLRFALSFGYPLEGEKLVQAPQKGAYSR
jgi:nitroreductase